MLSDAEVSATESMVEHLDIVLDIIKGIDLESVSGPDAYELGCAAGYVAAIRNSFADLT